MVLLQCRMCGGTLDIDREHNLAVCPYCGNKSMLFEREQKLYEQFRTVFASLLERKEENSKAAEGFWVEAIREEFTRQDGKTIEISWLFRDQADLCTMYVAKKHIIYIFGKQCVSYAERCAGMIRELKYPNEEMEQELKHYIPKLHTFCELEDGSVFIAMEKALGVYPLKLLTPLLDRHVAWVVSRLENLCCLLSYNGIVLNGLTIDNLFVDPAAHQIYLYGGWWFAGYENSLLPGMSGDVTSCIPERLYKEGRCREVVDLYSLRMTAARLLGYGDLQEAAKEAILPAAFRSFLIEEPSRDAVKDFAVWDQVLIRSYGERKFIPITVTEQEIYSRK